MQKVFLIDMLLSLHVLQVGESHPAPTQNQRAHGGSPHLQRCQSAWTMVRLPGENLLGAVGAGETATQTAMVGATQLCHLHLANLVSRLTLCGFMS